MNNKKAGIGVFLILMGVLTALGNLEMISDHMVLVVISAALLGAYMLTGAWNNRASIGFLIPGLIMSSISLFTILEEADIISSTNEGFLFLVMLGAAFLLIMPIHTMRFSRINWGEKYWPVFPGSILMIIGIMGLSFGEDKRIWGLVNPVILIGIGAFILLRPYLNRTHNAVNRFESSSNTNLSASSQAQTKPAESEATEKITLSKE